MVNYAVEVDQRTGMVCIYNESVKSSEIVIMNAIEAIKAARAILSHFGEATA